MNPSKGHLLYDHLAKRGNDGQTTCIATFMLCIKYVHPTETSPPKISSSMKSDQRVGMKVAGRGWLQDGGCKRKVAGVMVAEVKVAGMVVEGAAVVAGAVVGAWVAA